MEGFIQMLLTNFRRRFCDGFSIGYNIIFPAILILLLGAITRGSFTEGISSYGYYTVVTIPFCTALSIVTAAFAGKDDAYAMTAIRVMVAPVRKEVIVAVKVISCSAVFFLCSIVVFFIGGIACGLPIGGKEVIIVLFFLMVSFAVAALGTLIGLGIKNFVAIKNIVSVPIAILATAGGVFFRFGTSDKVLESFLCLSPFTWFNRGIFKLLYDGSSSDLVLISILLGVAGSLFTMLSIVCFKKEEYINGTIPGYEE